MANLTTTSTSGAPEWLQPYQAGYINQAQNVANTPYQQYGGSLISGFNQYQRQGLDAQAQRGMSGSPLMSGANQALQGYFGGQGQDAAQNQYGPISAPAGGSLMTAGVNGAQIGNFGGGQNITSGQNQYGPISAAAGGASMSAGYNGAQIGNFGGGQNITSGQNQFGGGNPYLQQNIDSAQGDMVRQFNNVQKPSWDSAMQQSGSFGNEGVASASQMARSDLQRNLGSVSSGMRMQDYTQQQQLAEAGLNRGMQAQQFNSGLGEAAANRSMTAQQFNSGITDQNLARSAQAQQFNSGLGEAAAGRNMQAQQFNSNMGQDFAQRRDSMYNSNQGRGMQALGLAPGFANQDYNDINAMTQAGNAYQSQDQRGLDSAYQQFQQARDYPRQQLDVMGRALQQSYGQNNTSTTPGPSGASQLFGGALTGAGLYNLMFGKP